MTSENEGQATAGRPRPVARALAVAAIGAAVAVAAFLRFSGLGVPSLWLDEILAQLAVAHAASQSWWEWLWGPHAQNGPLWSLVLGMCRIAGDGEAAARFPSALLGVATVALLGWAGWRATRDPWASAAAAILLAVSPLHVFTSREALPQAATMFLGVVALGAILLRRPLAAGIVVVLMLYSSAGAAAAVAAVFVAALATAGTQADPEPRRRLQVIAVTAMIALQLFLILYRREEAAPSAATFEILDPALFESLLRGLSTTAMNGEGGGRVAGAMLVLAIVGGASLFRRDRASAAAVVSMAAAPIVLVLAVLKLANQPFAIRYVAPALAAWLLLAGCGLAAVGRFAGRRFGPVVTLLLAAVLAASGWEAARLEPLQKLDWRTVAELVSSHAREGDVVVAAEGWSEVSLRYYLERTARPVPVVLATDGDTVQEAMRKSDATWFVTAGYSGDAWARPWMCVYPLLLASPLESFRLHYAPSRAHFLATRSREEERRAAAMAWKGRPVTIRMGPDADRFLLEGWAGAEAAGELRFRWIEGRTATLLVPRAERDDSVVRMYALPMFDPGAPQRLQLVLNGTVVGEQAMTDGWREYSFPVPGNAWSGTMNRLELRFARVTVPSQIDPHSGDHRRLAAALQWITVASASAPVAAPGAAPSIVPQTRLGAGVFLEEEGYWRGSITRYPPELLRREAVEALLARLGFDPVSTWPKIRSGDVRLDDVIETTAYDSGCESDVAFVRRSFSLLYERPPDESEVKGMLRELRSGLSRIRLVGRLVKMEEFRSKMLRQ